MRNLMEMVLATISNCNVTLGSMNSLKPPMRRLLQIDLQVIFTTFLLLLLVIFSSWLRCCNGEKFHIFIFTAYNLSTFLLTYSLSLMHDAPCRNKLFPIWAMLLMIAFRSSNSISLYSLDDNEQWKRNNWQLLTKLIRLVWLMELYFCDGSKVGVAARCLGFILAVKFLERARAMMAASRHSLEENTDVVVDHMMREHKRGGVSSVEVDPVSMRGYTYLVRGEEERWRRLGKKEAALAPNYRMTLGIDKLITYNPQLFTQVWNCKGRLLSSERDLHYKLKDTCLSFALFKLLRLRYAGYLLPQKAHENAWKLTRNGLLSHEDGYKRAFRVVEVELTFLFDFFYTKYGIIFHPSWLTTKLMELMGIAISIWAMTSLMKHHQRDNNKCNCLLTNMLNGLSGDIFITSLMITSFIIMELIQYFFMSFSEWAKMILICQYVQKKSWQESAHIESMIRAICGVWLLKPWEQKLHQYSFLDSYSYKPSRLLNNRIMAAFIDQTRDGQKESPPIQLSAEVKQAVFHALKLKNGTDLDNGHASLRRNNESKKLLWACRLETETQVIMVWHIATSFCEHRLPVRSDLPRTRDFLVATSLSKYLAYLAIIQARVFFGRCKTMEDWIKEMEKVGGGHSAHKGTIIEWGSWLENLLVNDIRDEEKIWKILANFWVELVLYMAPSNDVKAHAEHLAKGGEFVTHLWALLSHAGIKRKASH
ncbi:hypothetical protein ACJRO7_017573 [Eucalyptus globulus]|uniref:DUF4220 domain-containing protein n=1 Tax=Eucalyptus globulus TaxID=34317 RepID=A0ABD3KRY5_EUCGL